MDSIPSTSRSTDDEGIGRVYHDINQSSGDRPLKQYTVEVDNAEEEVEEKQRNPPPSSATLRSSPWILIIALTYTLLAVFAWTVLCVLTYKPITTAHYREFPLGCSAGDPEHADTLLPDTLTGTRDANPQSLFARNENWLQTVRVVQALVSVLTIPVVSAVCARAAVVFTQSSSKRGGLSLRKTITLASRGWNEPKVYARLCKGGYQRYGSSLLLFAVFLNILGTFQLNLMCSTLP